MLQSGSGTAGQEEVLVRSNMLSITSASYSLYEHDPCGIHMRGQRYPEGVHLGHGQAVVLHWREAFDRAPLGVFAAELPASSFFGTSEGC